MAHTLNVDFVTDGATTETEVLSEVDAWLKENDLTATVEIDKLVGPAAAGRA